MLPIPPPVATDTLLTVSTGRSRPKAASHKRLLSTQSGLCENQLIAISSRCEANGRKLLPTSYCFRPIEVIDDART